MIEVEKKIYPNSTHYYIKGSANKSLWYQHGILHREDGPAMLYNDGTKLWYRHGRLHREDGPAVEWSDGKKEWYINHNYFDTKEEWFEALTEENKAKAIYSEYFIRG
jgi:hypothetical protein